MSTSADRAPASAEIAAAEHLEAALCARGAGVSDREVRKAFGTEAAALAGLSGRLVHRSGFHAPEPAPTFVPVLEARLRAEHARRRPGAGVGILWSPLPGGWSSTAVVLGALLLAVAAFLASGGHGPVPVRTPTAWAATSTATGSTPAALATRAAPDTPMAIAHHVPPPVASGSIAPRPEATVDG